MESEFVTVEFFIVIVAVRIWMTVEWESLVFVWFVGKTDLDDLVLLRWWCVWWMVLKDTDIVEVEDWLVGTEWSGGRKWLVGPCTQKE